MNRFNKITRFAALAVFALSVAACGDGMGKPVSKAPPAYHSADAGKRAEMRAEVASRGQADYEWKLAQFAAGQRVQFGSIIMSCAPGVGINIETISVTGASAPTLAAQALFAADVNCNMVYNSLKKGHISPVLLSKAAGAGHHITKDFLRAGAQVVSATVNGSAVLRRPTSSPGSSVVVVNDTTVVTDVGVGCTDCM